MTRTTKSALSAHKNISQNPGINITAACSATLSEADALLSELLPHLSDAAPSYTQTDGAVPYSAIRRVRLDNGIKAVRLPNGRLLAKSLDRKLGKPFWVIVRG